MTGDGTAELRTLAFGDVDGTVWGGALKAASAALILGAGTGETGQFAVSEESWSAEGATWRLAADGVELVVEPATEEREPFPHEESGARVSGVQELCRVSGVVSLSGAEHRVDCPGIRSALEGIDPASLDSLRAVAGWFAPDEAFTLLALRGPRSPGQEADLVAATLFDPEGWVPVADPRLSTTYDGAGVPTRVNLELWVSEGENEFPRRAAGEAAAPSRTVTAPGLEMRAIPLRCHSRGREGGGVYVLAGL
ncbi:MAG TPA: hypothetical protein VGI07_00745 [Solirubrobacteraceae bacterium]|jgi:hypothetical protein